MSFLTDPTSSFWASKVNWRERPAVRTVQQWVDAEDLNQVRGALFDLRESVNSIVPLQSSSFPRDVLIYVRPSGSDTTGDGTLSNPFATFAHAMSTVPSQLDNYRYWIDVTGINEYLPNDIQFPARYGVPMTSFDIHQSSWDNVEFAGASPLIYPPPAGFEYCSFAENVNVVAQHSAAYTIPVQEAPSVSLVDSYSRLAVVSFGSNDWGANDFAGMFLANTHNPRTFIPIYRSVLPNSLYVSVDEDDVPITGSGWYISTPGANVTFVPGVSGSAAVPHAGIWLGGGTSGIQLHGLQFNRHPALNIEAQWVLMEQGGAFITNACKTNTSGTNWGRNIVTEGASFRAYQSFLNGITLQGGSELAAVGCVVEGSPLLVQTGSFGSSRVNWVGMGVREMVFSNGSSIQGIGIAPGAYIFRNILVQEQPSSELGSQDAESMSRVAAISLLNFNFQNASGTADVSVLNNWSAYMSGGYIAGNLLVSEESHLIARGLVTLRGVELNDGSIFESYGCTFGSDPTTIDRIYIHNDSNFSMKGGSALYNTTVYSYDRSKVYLSRITATYDSSLTASAGAYFTSGRASELILRSPCMLTATVGTTTTFPEVKYGLTTATLGQLSASYKLESTDLGEAGTFVTWVP
jgi:hypothetical protein